MNNKEKLTKLIEWLEKNGYKDTVYYKNPDYVDAIIGISISGSLVYDYDLMAESLMEDKDYEFNDISEAYDFISYNSDFSADIEGERPIILHRFID